jgi:hypothetical protein
VAPAAGWAVASWAAGCWAGWAVGSAHVTAFWAGNQCRELLRLGLPERLEPASLFRGAGGFGDRGLRVAGGFGDWGLRAAGGFVGLQGIARVQGNPGIASQLLRRVVVVSYSNYYMRFGWCCDWVGNAKLSEEFCIR